MNLPQALLDSLQGVQGYNEQSFKDVHASAEKITSVRINPNKSIVDSQRSIESLSSDIHHSRFTIDAPIPWSSFGYYLSQRPSFTFDPPFHAGCYYVQEASSMFLEQALKQTVDLSTRLKVLDLCAAPGGKSTHIQSLISPTSLLVSNEVIRARAGILKQNIIKWGCNNVIVTNNDPQHFSKLKGFFDVMVVDAPCSGSGLFRKDNDAVEEWSPENVALCCGRQKRIIKDAIDALKEDGVLIYSTCSYSKDEDEDIADWLVEELAMKNEQLKIDQSWGIIETTSDKTGSYGYRFFPDKIKGEGFYLACFRKKSGAESFKGKAAKIDIASAKEKAIVQPWLSDNDITLFKAALIFALPSWMAEDYGIIKAALNVYYAGVAVGEIMKERLVPDHALALSNIISGDVNKTELTYEEAIRYLQRAEVSINTDVKGWQLVTYNNHNLGWINALPNRINNYYPKELRILKQRDDTAFEK